MACTCQRCGRKFKVDFNVPNGLWEQIKPKGNARGGGLLCGPCITEAIEHKGKYGAYNAEERKERKEHGPEGVKRDRPTPSREDFIRMGLSEISLGTLGLHISIALFKLAWEQRDTASVPGEIVLKSWNHLCRTINPDFDQLKRGAKSNYRRRVQRAVMQMTRLRLYLKYNKLGKPYFVNTMWIKRYEREVGSNTIILELGVLRRISGGMGNET